MERKRTGRLLAAFVVALFASLGIVLGLGSTAHAKEYKTLSVGDVLHVGDSINSTTTYHPSETSFLAPDVRPWTLVRGGVVWVDDVAEVFESETGPYYFFKCDAGWYGFGYDPDFFGTYYEATATSDGIYVNELYTAANRTAQVRFAVHEGVAVMGMTLEPSEAQTIAEGGKFALTATIAPDDATDRTVKWSVGGTDSAAVSLYSDKTCETPVELDTATETLTVYAKGVAAGEATITCTSNADSDKFASCDVTVETAAVPVKSVELDKVTATLEPGKTVSLNAIVKPDYATNKSVTWKSSNETIATVKDGVVTAVAEGRATITAKSVDNDECTAECVVTVKAPKHVPTPAPAIAKVIMHRLYNPNSGEHFYTANAGEKNHLVSVGWNYEGTGWIAPKTSSKPVYRLYNENAGDHHYTMSNGERKSLISVGWKDEGIGWYSADANGAPLYRQYNPNAIAGSHNYTLNINENNALVRLGWHGEGIGWYGLR